MYLCSFLNWKPAVCILFKFPGTEFQIQEIHSVIRSFLLPHLIPVEPSVLLGWYGKMDG